MYYVYILFSRKLKKRYIGSTSNLKERIVQHNDGATPFTPWQLIYYEVFQNKQDALDEERFLKSGKGRDRLNFLLKQTMANLGR